MIKKMMIAGLLIGIGVLIIFLLWDIQPIRSTLKKMPGTLWEEK